MEVDINIDSYPSSDFGVLKGTILRIGTDSLRPSKGLNNSEDIYPVRVKLLSQQLKPKDSKPLDLRVGMTVKGNIKFNLLYDKNSSLQKKIKLEQLRKEIV